MHQRELPPALVAAIEDMPPADAARFESLAGALLANDNTDDDVKALLEELIALLPESGVEALLEYAGTCLADVASWRS